MIVSYINKLAAQQEQQRKKLDSEVLLAALCGVAEDGVVREVGNWKMAELSGLTDYKVTQAINKLKRAGIVREIKKRNKQAIPIYIITRETI